MSEGNSILEVTGLRSGYSTIPVLHGVSFAVGRGEALGILGHNGMGKTTLLKTLIGALPATAGKIAFDGVDVTRHPTHRRVHGGMAYVPQSREIFPALSVYDNLRFGALKASDASGKAVDELLADFPRLERLLARNGGSLSGGEQQLLALARALAGNPSLLLLDEPTEGIQPSIIDEIADTLTKLRLKRGLAIVLVEQNLEFISSVSERVLVIRRGKMGGEIPREHLTDLDLVNRYAGVHG